MKLHKDGNPIRPVINNKHAPSYKAAKRLNKILQQRLNLGNQYTVVNSVTLVKDLTKISISNKHRLITMDIKDLYVNIPIAETTDITTKQLLQHNDPETTAQICTLLGVILQQNYFIFQQKIYQPDKGIAMGSPISGTIDELFPQHLEQIYIKPLIETKHILFYTRYINDILIIYDAKTTNHDYLTQYTKSIHSNLQFNPTPESEGHINFLDLRITRRNTHIEIDIYRNPTTTDTTIHFTSAYLDKHKLAAYRYHITRTLSLPLKTTQQKREWVTILHSAQQNGFPPTMIHKLRHQIEHKTKHIPPQDRKNKKWVTFTYISP